MITFILIFAALIIVVAGWLVASGANQRKRARQADGVHVQAQMEDGGAPAVKRASGIN